MKIKYFSRSELVRLLKYSKRKDYLLYSLCYLGYIYGMRVSEVLQLRRSDVDFCEKKIIIRRLKGSNTTQHILTPEAEQVLKVAEGRYDRKYFNIHRSYVDVKLKKACRQLKIKREKAHFHTLKHTLAIDLLNNDTNIRKIQLLLGHKDIRSTLVYLTIAGAHLDKETISINELLNLEIDSRTRTKITDSGDNFGF